MQSAVIQSSSVLLPVGDLSQALNLFCGPLGMPLKFRDGGRYAALGSGGFTLALLAGSEQIVDRPALGLRVDNLRAAVTALVAAGAQVVSAPEEGPHEWRAVLHDHNGNPLVLSAKVHQ